MDILHGDCLSVMPTLGADSIDACVTDPPYGLSSADGASNGVYPVLAKVGFPDLVKMYAEAAQGGDLSGVSSESAFLAGIDGPVRVMARVTVPECSVDLQDGAGVQNEVGDATEATSRGLSDNNLAPELNADFGQCVGDFMLDIGDLATWSVGDLPGNCIPEFFLGGFAVPICAPLLAGLPCLGAGRSVIDFSGEVVRLLDNTQCQPGAAACIGAGAGTINALMLRFDLSGRPIELRATNRASELATLGASFGPKLVRTSATASGLSAVAQPYRVRLVILGADGTRSFHIRVWAPTASTIIAKLPRGGFMGKAWDAMLPDPEVWREVFRVLKPGAHLVAFGGTRTFHRLVCAIEDAGFEIRDQGAWLYGSGFPKSLDVSKAIDARKDWSALKALQGEVRTARKRLGISQSEAARRSGIIAPDETLGGGGFMWFETGKRVPTRDQWPALKAALQLPDSLDAAFEAAEREVVGEKQAGMGTGKSFGMLQSEGTNATAEKTIPITAPATPAAQQWSGWGTALKPAHEPICFARKPLVGTVAENVLRYGTGALNVDGCRVGTGADKGIWPVTVRRHADVAYTLSPTETDTTAGRWPANVMHDGSPEVLAVFPETASGKPGTMRKCQNVGAAYGAESRQPGTAMTGYGDAGSAARFFYSPKASKRDRDEGLEAFEARRCGGMSATADGTMLTGAGNERTTTRANVHPTVKPTDLMRWLCRLVTPPGGVVLDPFTGSGSTGKAAVLEGFRFIGIEREAEYVEIARARIAAAQASAPLLTAAE